MKLLRKWYGRWLAGWIERAYTHPAYGANKPFLCAVILTEFKSPLRYLVLRHIRRALGYYLTVREHLIRTWDGPFPYKWIDREQHHKLYWGFMCVCLQAGDFTWNFRNDLKEIKMATRKVYSGPYGNYPAGSVGAVMNAMSEQEGIPLWRIDSYVFGNGRILNRGSETLAGEFTWNADDSITIAWVDQDTCV